jgi:hypothetical protein
MNYICWMKCWNGLLNGYVWFSFFIFWILIFLWIVIWYVVRNRCCLIWNDEIYEAKRETYPLRFNLLFLFFHFSIYLNSGNNFENCIKLDGLNIRNERSGLVFVFLLVLISIYLNSGNRFLYWRKVHGFKIENT